jgi:hypothetical protein
MKLLLALTVLFLAACSLSVQPSGMARAQELCAVAGGLVTISSQGSTREGGTSYEAVCKDGTGISFKLK